MCLIRKLEAKMKIAIILIAIIGLVSARLPPPGKQLAASSSSSSSSTPEPGSDDTGVMIEKEASVGSTTDDSSDDDEQDHVPQYPFNVLRKVFNIHLRPMSTSFNNFPGMSDTPFVRMQPMFPQNPYSIFSMDPTVIRNRPSLLGSQPGSMNSQFPSIFGRPFEFPFPRMPHFPSMGVDHPSLFDPQYEKNLATKGYNVTKSFLPNSDNKMVIIRSVKNTTDTYAEFTKVRPFNAEMDKDLVNDETSSPGEDKKENDRREVETKTAAEHEIEGSANEKPAGEDKKAESESSGAAAASSNVPAAASASAPKQPKPEVKEPEKQPEKKSENEAEKEAKAAEVAKTDVDDKPAENEIPKSGSDAEIKSEDTPIITVNDNNHQ